MSYRTIYYMASPRQLAALDLPIGDPYGGPAAGKYEKSSGLGMVVGIVASVATMGAGAAAWAAAESVGAMISAGAMMAGGAMSAIGTITGNKNLMKIGGVLSLAGGVSSAFMTPGGAIAKAGEQTLGEAAMQKAGESWNSAWKSVVGDGANAGVDAANTAASQTISTGADSLVTQPTALDTLNSAPGMDLTKAAGVPSAGAGVPGADSVSSITNDVAAQTASVADGNGLLSPGATPSSAGVSTNLSGGTLQPPLATSAPPAASKGLIGSVMDFAKTPGGGQLTGEVLKGIGAGYTNDQLLAQRQEVIDYNKLLTDRGYANANSVAEIIDPSAPDAAQRIAAAKQKNVPIKLIGVNANANIQPPNLTPPQGA